MEKSEDFAMPEEEPVDELESAEIVSAANSSTFWSALLVILLTLCGAGIGLRSQSEEFVVNVILGVFGAFLGFAIGMFFHSQRRLQAKMAVRMDQHFNSRHDG